MKIDFLPLKDLNATHAEALKRIANDIIDSGWYLLGERVKEFEQKFSKAYAIPNVITTANGLDALRIILRAYKEQGFMKDGDEIIVASNTYIASIISILDNGLVPVLVEPDPETLNLDLNKVEQFITPRTRGVMVVHLYGQVCWSNELESLAQKYQFKIIEDNAQSIGGMYHERYTGNLGDAAGFSFYPGKNLGALGDAGAVTTKDPELGKIIRSLANYGSNKKYYNDYVGYNSRMDELQAGFLLEKFKYLEADTEKRKKIAYQYSEALKKNPLIGTPKAVNDHVYHLYVVQTPHRDELQAHLKTNGIGTLIHYPIPPHLQKALSFLKIEKGTFPITEKLAENCLSIPLHPKLSGEEVNYIIDVTNAFHL